MDQDWPAQSSELWPIEKITPYARNSRTHSDEQVAQIAASIREWGWTNPILVDEDGGLIAGHGRLLAARKLGLTQIPTMVAKGWSEAQKKAYVRRLQQMGEQLDGGNITTRRVRADLKPIVGTRLIREWQGVEHTVTVTQDGFEWQGRPYQSLSAIARAVTGSRWNGWIFFGLKDHRRAA